MTILYALLVLLVAVLVTTITSLYDLTIYNSYSLKYTYLTTYSLWSAMHELSLLLN